MVAKPGRGANACINTAVRFICWNQVPGDYLEFGCYSASTFCLAHRLFASTRASVAEQLNDADKGRFLQDKPRFFAFDSFEGLPESERADHHPYLPMHWKKHSYAMTQADFESKLSEEGVDLAEVQVVKGWYQTTLTNETKRAIGLRRASLVHIDCDYYESAILALNFITDLIDDGTVVVFDDYNFYRGSSQLGERRAFSEWLAKNPAVTATELARCDFDKVAFFLNIKR
jgi:hypothetical protein